MKRDSNSIIMPVIFIFFLIIHFVKSEQVATNSRPGNEFTENRVKLPPQQSLIQQQSLIHSQNQLSDQHQFRPGPNPMMMNPMNPYPMNPYGGGGGGMMGGGGGMMGGRGGGGGCKIRCDRLCDPSNPYQGCQTRCFRECCSIEPMMLGPGPGIGGHGPGIGGHGPGIGGHGPGVGHGHPGAGFNGLPPSGYSGSFPPGPFPMKSKAI